MRQEKGTRQEKGIREGSDVAQKKRCVRMLLNSICFLYNGRPKEFFTLFWPAIIHETYIILCRSTQR